MKLSRSFIFTFERIEIDRDINGKIRRWSLLSTNREYKRSEQDSIILENVFSDGGRWWPRLRLSFLDEDLSDIILLIPGMSWLALYGRGQQKVTDTWSAIGSQYGLKMFDTRTTNLIP